MAGGAGSVGLQIANLTAAPSSGGAKDFSPWREPWETKRKTPISPGRGERTSAAEAAPIPNPRMTQLKLRPAEGLSHLQWAIQNPDSKFKSESRAEARRYKDTGAVFPIAQS